METIAKEKITKEVKEHYGTLSETEKGWTKEINLVSWNGREAKIDIREWAPDKVKTGKGVTFKQSEFEDLKRIINGIVLPVSTLTVAEDEPASEKETEKPVEQETSAEKAIPESVDAPVYVAAEPVYAACGENA